jgi:tRNA(Ile)-lysidine synthase
MARSLALLCARSGLARPHVCVAYSGGLDSSVLLALLADARARGLVDLTALHVHHGLSPNADDWVAHCERRCAHLGIALTVRRVSVRRAGGESLEEQARDLRHAALRAVDADVVALAHHADDQVETVLLQMLRGAGPRGLAAMAEVQPSAAHRSAPWIWRPLLEFTRGELARFVAVECLSHIEDESNARWDARRNVLRHGIVPGMVERFPDMHATIGRVARLQGEAAALLGDLANIDLAAVTIEGGALDCTRLNQLPDARVANLMRHWILGHGTRAPSAARLGALISALRRSTNDTRLEWRHEDLRVRRRRERLELERVQE